MARRPNRNNRVRVQRPENPAPRSPQAVRMERQSYAAKARLSYKSPAHALASQPIQRTGRGRNSPTVAITVPEAPKQNTARPSRAVRAASVPNDVVKKCKARPTKNKGNGSGRKFVPHCKG